MSQSNKRLTILTNEEIEGLYARPHFDEKARACYFELDEQEQAELSSIRSSHAKVYFILQIGYFKCKFTFFTFTFKQVAADVSHILSRYFPKARLSQKDINKKTRQMHQGRILQLFGYQAFDEPVKRRLLERALDAIRVQAGPVSVLEQLLDFLNENRICIPGYSTLQDIVSQAFLIESKRLHSIIRHNTTTDVEHSLTRLFEGEEDLEKISALKKQAKGFNHQEVLKEVDKKQRYARLYAFAQTIIPKLQISTQNIS